MNMIKFTKRISFAARQRGQGMSEYIIIVALIAVGAIGVFTAFGGTIRHQVAAMTLEIAGKDGSTETTSAGTISADAVTSAEKVKGMATYSGGAKY